MRNDDYQYLHDAGIHQINAPTAAALAGVDKCCIYLTIWMDRMVNNLHSVVHAEPVQC